MVRPGAVRLFRARGIGVHEVQRDVSVQCGQEGIEIDLLVVNDTDFIISQSGEQLILRNDENFQPRAW